MILPEIEFDGVDLSDVLDFFQDISVASLSSTGKP